MKPHFDVQGLKNCLLEAKNKVECEANEILASYSMPWSEVNFFELFAANYQNEQPVTFWGKPSNGSYFVSFGCAIEFGYRSNQTFLEINVAWKNLIASSVIVGKHQPTLYGGFAFDASNHSTSLWEDYPSSALTLPKFTIQHENNCTRLIINVLVDVNTNYDQTARELEAASRKIFSRKPNAVEALTGSFPEPKYIDQALWQFHVASAVSSIKEKEFEKVVLARTEELLVECCPGAVLEKLSIQQSDTNLFAFARGRSCFIGASPERLVAIKDNHVSTVALAGSAQRAQDPEEDKLLGMNLLNSKKERHEHDLVVSQLKTVLNKYCDEVTIPPRPVLNKLGQIQHLLTPIEGYAKRRINLFDLLVDLHPTPAVGGFPKQAAIKYIRENEGLDRGWYAAPIGWLNSNGECEFAVALRSALLHEQKVTLFAGCGLVEASIPAEEYRESCIKMNAIREAIRSVTLVNEIAEY